MVEPEYESLAVDPDLDAEVGAVMKVLVSANGIQTKLELTSGLVYCDYVDAAVEPLEGSAGRLALANLGCDNGEDYATRESLTALIVVAPRGMARVAWEGASESRRDMTCMTDDIVHFELREDGDVAVIRTQETYGDPFPEAGVECEPQGPVVTEIGRVRP